MKQYLTWNVGPHFFFFLPTHFFVLIIIDLLISYQLILLYNFLKIVTPFFNKVLH